MAKLDGSAWGDFYHRSLEKRLSPSQLEPLIDVMYEKYPLPGRIIAKVLLLQVKPNADVANVDPRVLLYFQQLLHLGKCSYSDILSSLLASLEETIQDREGNYSHLEPTRDLFEIDILQALIEEVRQDQPAISERETCFVLEPLLGWLSAYLHLAQMFHDGLTGFPAYIHSMGDTLGYFMLALANSSAWATLAVRGFPKGIKVSLGQRLTQFISILANLNIELATAIDSLQKQAGLFDDRVPHMEASGILDTTELDKLTFLQNVLDNQNITTRASLYVYLNAMFVGVPTFDDTLMLGYLHMRYPGNVSGSVTSLITTSFDMLANAMYRNEPNSFIFIIRSYLVNKLPIFLLNFSDAIFPPLDFEYCLTQALQHAGPPEFPSFTQIFNPLNSSGMLSEARQEFLFACALHELILEESIERLLEDVPMQSLPEKGRYTKEDIVSQCHLRPTRIEELIGELENMDGNAGAIASALVEILESLCATKDTMTLKGLCGPLARKTQALDVLMLFSRPANVIQPLSHLLDQWVFDEDQGEPQPFYDEFANIFLLILVIEDHFCLPHYEACVDYSSSFVSTHYMQGSSSKPLETLTSDEDQLVGDWVRGLFGNDEGISDELLSKYKPQSFYLLFPTILKQSLKACSAGLLSLDTLKGGFEYLLQPSLVPCLVSGLQWFANTLWETSGKGDALDNALTALQTLLNPPYMSSESSSMHKSVISVAAKPLIHSLIHVQRKFPRRLDIDPLLQVLRFNASIQCSDAIPATEAESWSSTPQGGLLAALRHTIRTLVQWESATSLDSTPPNYTHKQLLTAVHILGSKVVLNGIIDEVLTMPDQSDAALDITTTLLVAPERPLFNQKPRLDLCVALNIEHDNILNIAKEDVLRAETIVRLQRRAQAYWMGSQQQAVVAEADEMILGMDSVNMAGETVMPIVTGLTHTDIDNVLAEAEGELATEELLTDLAGGGDFNLG